MLTDVWFNKKTKLFEFDNDTYKAIVPLNFFDDRTLNGHFGVEFKVKNGRATVVLTALRDNPGVDLSLVANLAAMSVFENFLRFFEIKSENVFWVVNRPDEKGNDNLAHIIFLISPVVVHQGQELQTYGQAQWNTLDNLKQFLAMSSLHLLGVETKEK